MTIGPTPPYNNPPIEPQYYLPSVFFISAVALGQVTTITTSVEHNYVIGQLVRLIIPFSYGCRQLNERQGYVVAVPSANQVLLDINSIGSDPFVSGFGTTMAQILAIGDVNTGAQNAFGRVNNGTFIPGSFIDISPA
jgi:hypothetical protein